MLSPYETASRERFLQIDTPDSDREPLEGPLKDILAHEGLPLEVYLGNTMWSLAQEMRLEQRTADMISKSHLGLATMRDLLRTRILRQHIAGPGCYVDDKIPSGKVLRSFRTNRTEASILREDYESLRVLSMCWSLPQYRQSGTDEFSRVELVDRYGDPQSGPTGIVHTFFDIPEGDSPDHYTLTMQLHGDPFYKGDDFDYYTLGGKFRNNGQFLIPAQT